ncbi:hypothetical protein CEXT_516311 [Caerostris extrusa]|uniref:Uncharacterized protein n=1 Tax=Caerostris extrusa TaxID=172846 RepID=A0AAV4NBG2_CAEEX|nr:hypothetical protein CEXT_516311 [Caerostris extrusa]
MFMKTKTVAEEQIRNLIACRTRHTTADSNKQTEQKSKERAELIGGDGEEMRWTEVSGPPEPVRLYYINQAQQSKRTSANEYGEGGGCAKVGAPVSREVSRVSLLLSLSLVLKRSTRPPRVAGGKKFEISSSMTQRGGKCRQDWGCFGDGGGGDREIVKADEKECRMCSVSCILSPEEVMSLFYHFECTNAQKTGQLIENASENKSRMSFSKSIHVVA